MAPNYEEIAASVKVEEELETIIEDGKLPAREVLREDDPRYQGIATARGYDQSYGRIKRPHYSHDAMIDVIVGDPNITQNELAKMFEKSVPWISRIIGSDAFQAALAKRRADLTDPYLVASIEERFKGVVTQSLEIIAEKLDSSRNTDLALKTLDVGVKALGYGARGGGGNQQNNQFIIQLPSKSISAEDWRDEHAPMKQVGNG